MSFELIPSDEFRVHLPAPLKGWLEDTLKADLGISAQWADLQSIDNIEEFWAINDRSYGAELAHRVIRGLALLAIRSTSERDFQQGLKARGIPFRSATRLMAVARACMEARSLESMHRLAQFEFRGAADLVEFLGLDAFADLIDGKKVMGLTLTAAQAMTVKEVAEWRKGVIEKDERVRKLSKENEGLRRQIESYKDFDAALPKPDALATVREELLKLGEEIHARMDIAEKLYDELISAKPKSGRASWQHDAAQFLNCVLAPELARIVQLQARSRKDFGLLVANEEAPIELSPASAKKFLAQRARIHEEVERAAAGRAQARDKRRGGRGRPVTSLDSEVRKLASEADD